MSAGILLDGASEVLHVRDHSCDRGRHQTHNANLFALDRQGDATEVLSIMNGSRPCKLKVSLFVSSNKLLGKHVETGLAKLKSVTEASA